MRTEIFLLLLLLIPSLVFAQPAGKGVVSVADEDLSPEVFPWQIKFPSGSVTDNNDGTASVSFGSGDITSVGDCTEDDCFEGTSGTTLTFNNAGGDGTFAYDGTDFTLSHVTRIPPGSTTAPALTSDADVNTGFYWNAGNADIMHLTSGGTTMLTLENTQFVGIMDNDPEKTLDVTGQVRVQHNGTTAAPSFILGTGINNTGLNYVSTDHIDVVNGAALTMRFTGGSNVGIGTSTAATLLTVGSAGVPGVAAAGDVYIKNDLEVDGITYADGGVTAASIQLDTSSTGVTLDTDGDGLLIVAGTGNGNDEDLRFNFDDGSSGANTIEVTSGTGANLINFTSIGSTWGGNVGIGATTPASTLDLGAGTEGRGITWKVTPTTRYSNIWSNFSDATLFLSNGLQENIASVVPQYSVTGTMGVAAIALNGFAGGSTNRGNISFFTEPSASTTQGTAYTTAPKMTLTNAGNLGIGTIMPIGGRLIVKSHDETGTAQAIQLIDSNTTTAVALLDQSAADGSRLRLRNGSTTDIQWDTAGDSYIATGNVGIGTIIPNGRLAVMGGNVGIGTWIPGALLQVAGTGNVGIGTTIPRSILEVQIGSGTAQITVDGTTGACLMLQDTDGAGWTECDALNGVLTCSTDADGICE